MKKQIVFFMLLFFLQFPVFANNLIKNCYNTGKITATTAKGGIVGISASSIGYTDCFYNVTCISDGNTIGTSKTDIELRNENFVLLMNGEPSSNAWLSTPGLNNDYPYLSWQLFYVPNAPTNVVATAGNTQVSVAFTTPTSNGGSSILDYTVTPYIDNTPCASITSSNNPIVIKELLNNLSYNFKVTARNAIGNSSESISSNIVMPHSINNIISILSTTNIGDIPLTEVSDIDVSGNLIINTDKTVNSITIEPNAKLDLSNNTLSVADLTLKAGKSTSASVSVTNLMNISGKFELHKALDNTKWYFMSFPCNVIINEITQVSGEEVLSLGNNWWIKYYDGESRVQNLGTISNWKQMFAGEVLIANKGYIIGLAKSLTGDYELSFPLDKNLLAAPETAKVTSVTAWGEGAVTANHVGWNLVGSPYLSKISGSGVGANYLTFFNGTSYTQLEKASVAEINPFDAFFVQASETGTSSQLSFAIDSRLLNRRIFDNYSSEIIELNFNNTMRSDKTTLIMDNNKSSNYEIDQDLEKWLTIGTDMPQIYSRMNNINYAFNSLPKDSVSNLSIGFYTKNEGRHTISSNAIKAPSLSKLLLRDKLIGVTTDLLTSDYDFISSIGTYNNRFVISAQFVKTGNNSIIPLDDLFSQNIIIENGKLYIHNIDREITVKVFDCTGRMLVNKYLKNTSLNVSLHRNNMYIIQIFHRGKNWSKKLLL